MLCNSYSSKILYAEFHWTYLWGDIKLLLVTVNNRLIPEIKIVHNLSCHPIVRMVVAARWGYCCIMCSLLWLQPVAKCDPFTNNPDKLFHYLITMSPHTNFLVSDSSAWLIAVVGKWVSELSYIAPKSQKRIGARDVWAVIINIVIHVSVYG